MHQYLISLKIYQLFLLILPFPAVESARILVLTPFFGRSHSIYTTPIVSELGRRGHEITLITSNLIKNPPPNIVQIDVSDSSGGLKDMDPNGVFRLESIPIVAQSTFLWSKMLETTDAYLSNPAVQNFIIGDNSHYDLVICELFFHEAFYAFSYKYKAPLVLLGSSTHWSNIDRFMGNPTDTVLYRGTQFSRQYGNLNILQRLNEYWISIFDYLGNKFYRIPQQNKLLEKHFGNLPKPLPTIGDLEKNVSLVLFNTHFSFDLVKPTVPGVLEIGGVHLKPADKLPQNLQEFLDGATDGVIYMSLGSNIKSSAMPAEKLDIFIKVFSSIKQRILWKWEGNDPPKYDNVMTSKWFPQTDVLAHPNIKMFITQTGMLSTQEAVHRGVPVIGIPVYGDQHMNIAKLVYHGFGIGIPFSKLTEDKLRNAISMILNDPIYSKTAKEVSNRFHDQLNTPLETAVFWIEYVIRHNGARFMKSRLPDVPLYQYYYLDVYVLLTFVLIIIILILRLIYKFLCRRKPKQINEKKRN